ncbi:sensor histidine kinase [Streptomyces marincola]|uniref:sensor histidine kinase n=1 Tax=Streptomyces marincola TaxID=2878388 RepID=UPI001CF1552F|nr:histidine kinase [Streptomyces marincola]UCM87749.1 histidine kinase [Streptomyces marincola]
MTTWLTRAVGDRFGPVRLLPLFVGIGYLLFVQRSDPTTGDWLVTVLAGLVFAPGAVWPLAVTVAEAALVVGAQHFADATPVAVKVLASVALLELAVRRPLHTAAIGTAAVACAYVAVMGKHQTADSVWAVGYRVLCVTAAPLLLGAYLRAAARALDEARARAAEAERRRALAESSARLAERTELARELHDLVAHHVASMALRVGVARTVLPGLDPKVSAVLDDVHGSATTALADLRRMVAVLRDPAAVHEAAGVLLAESDELPTAVATVAGRSTRAGLPVDCHVDPEAVRLDSMRGLVVLRVVQEGLTNAVKHAGAGARARVAVAIADGEVTVEVTDDGGAPEPGPAGGQGARARQPQPVGAVAAGAPEPGFGLVGLRERLGLVGGVLTAGPHEGGWRLSAAFPAASPSAGSAERSAAPGATDPADGGSAAPGPCGRRLRAGARPPGPAHAS